LLASTHSAPCVTPHLMCSLAAHARPRLQIDFLGMVGRWRSCARRSPPPRRVTVPARPSVIAPARAKAALRACSAAAPDAFLPALPPSTPARSHGSRSHGVVEAYLGTVKRGAPRRSPGEVEAWLGAAAICGRGLLQKYRDWYGAGGRVSVK
jgi:hypothetical protein